MQLWKSFYPLESAERFGVQYSWKKVKKKLFLQIIFLFKT